ncbi:putative integral membrane protein [Chitinispirillum alkaliphilum]|nr:putative integral membrane protein [Chitinispirillum alkaliphilum]
MNKKDKQEKNGSTVELFSKIKNQILLLMKKEIALVKAELKADVKKEINTVKGLILSAVLALLAISMLLVTVIILLGALIPLWLSALIVSVTLLLLAALTGYFSYNKRLKAPLIRTRKTIHTDIAITKGKIHGSKA